MYSCTWLEGYSGATFSRRMYDLMGKVDKPHYKIRLSQGFHEDIQWWIQFAATFNGKAKILGTFVPIQEIYSDASNWGYGAVFNNDWVVCVVYDDWTT